MKLIRMKTLYASPKGTCLPGNDIWLEDIEADCIIKSGYGIQVGVQQEKMEKKEIENTISKEPIKTAEVYKRRGRK